MLDVGSLGTTMRLMLSILARVIQPLAEMGAQIWERDAIPVLAAARELRGWKVCGVVRVFLSVGEGFLVGVAVGAGLHHVGEIREEDHKAVIFIRPLDLDGVVIVHDSVSEALL
jgi:5-enolpyruvylshikimate-3-phosphate synthase